MDLLLFLGLYFLAPAVIVAALAAAASSWIGITGKTRLFCMSLAVAAAVSPVFSGGAHGVPMSFIVELIFSSGTGDALFGHPPDGPLIYLAGVVVLTLLVALVLQLFFRRWAHGKSRRT